MSAQILIDANNLLHALHAQAVGRHIGRETLVRWIERWAAGRADRVAVVFDGAPPKGAAGRQMQSRRIEVLFAAPQSADDVLVRMLGEAEQPASLRLVSGDKALQYEARLRKCPVIPPNEWIEELLAAQRSEAPPRRRPELPP